MDVSTDQSPLYQPVLTPMNTNMRTTVVALILAIFAFAPLSNIKAEDGIEKTQTQLEELLSYITKEKKGKEPLLWKHEKAVDPFSEHYEVVLVAGKERITLAYFPDKDGRLAFLSFWWRPNGTTSRETMWTSSVSLDGVTSGGSDPTEKKNAMLGPDRSPKRQVGTEHRQFWQDECNKRIQAAIAYYRGKK